MPNGANNAAIEHRVTSLEIKVAVMESDIKNVKEDIGSIKDDTRWLRRSFTGAMITAGVGGFIALVFFLIRFVITQ